MHYTYVLHSTKLETDDFIGNMTRILSNQSFKFFIPIVWDVKNTEIFENQLEFTWR